MEEITAVTRDISEHNWNDRDTALLEMSDDLCADNCVSQQTWDKLRRDWKEDELIELVMVAGTYRLVSGFLNTMGVELDAQTPGWPEK
jgi:alkylhydroperoxidase family enzyme